MNKGMCSSDHGSSIVRFSTMVFPRPTFAEPLIHSILYPLFSVNERCSAVPDIMPALNCSSFALRFICLTSRSSQLMPPLCGTFSVLKFFIEKAIFTSSTSLMWNISFSLCLGVSGFFSLNILERLSVSSFSPSFASGLSSSTRLNCPFSTIALLRWIP